MIDADRIRDMSAGEEMDRLVAEAIGWTDLSDYGFGEWIGLRPGSRLKSGIPKFSTDIAAAWEVVEKMMTRHTQDFHFGYRMCDGTKWLFGFQDKVHGYFGNMSAEGETAPLAICRAALLAMEAQQ